MVMEAGLPFMRIIEMVLVLLTGPTGQDLQSSRIQRDTYPNKSAVYAHFHLSELRKQIFQDKELKKAIFKDKESSVAFASALTELGKQISVEEGALLKVAGSARGIGFWMDAKPKPNQIPKMLLAVDFGEKAIGLIPMMKIYAKLARMEYMAMDEDGVEIHTFRADGDDRAVHAVVRDGMVALSLDPKSVKSFMKAKKPEPKKPVEGECFTIQTSGPDIADMIRAAAGQNDRKEANLVIGLFDLGSYKSITGSIAMNKVAIGIDMDPNGAAARIIKPGKNNRLAKAFPAADSLGYFISLADPPEVWRFIKGQLSMHLANEFQFIDRALAEMKREIGIDIEGELIPSLQGFFQFFPIESIAMSESMGTVFAFQFKSADLAQKNLDTFMKSPEVADEMMKAQLKGHAVIRQKDLEDSPIVARKGSTIMLAGELGRETDPESIGLVGIDALTRMNKAVDTSQAVAGARASLDSFLGRDMPEITLEVVRKENRLEATFSTSFTPFASWLLSGKPLFAHEVPRNKARMLAFYGIMKAHVDKSDGTYPRNLWNISEAHNLRRGWVNPNTGDVRRFTYVSDIGKNTPNKSKVFLINDPEPFSGKRNVIFLDGSIKSLDEKAFNELKKKQSDLKSGLICDLPEAEREKVRSLCKLLGDKNFKNRREARKKLEEMGGSILPILREFENHSDPEVKISVKKLIDKYTPKKDRERPNNLEIMRELDQDGLE